MSVHTSLLNFLTLSKFFIYKFYLSMKIQNSIPQIYSLNFKGHEAKKLDRILVHQNESFGADAILRQLDAIASKHKVHVERVKYFPDTWIQDEIYFTPNKNTINSIYQEKYNYFEEFIKKEAVRANRQNQKFTVIGIDLDHLKKINDVYGHNYGDIAIKAIADVLKKSCRSIDIAARMGGEEFNVILSGVDSQGGMVFAERIRKTIESITLEKIGNITASIGVATFLEHTNDVDDLIELADQAMYKAKINGRNQVVVAKTKDASSWQETAIDAFVDILTQHRIPFNKNLAQDLIEKLKTHRSSGGNLQELRNDEKV